MAKQYGLVFDANRCIGCRTCVIACKAENEIEVGSWIKLVNDRGTPTDLPVGTYPRLSLSWRVSACLHCENPPCQAVCPAEGAIYQRPDGVVLIDREQCTGCQACGEACPYDAIRFDPEDGRPGKCTLCSHRLDQGLEPFCVKECIWGALRFMDTGEEKNCS